MSADREARLLLPTPDDSKQQYLCDNYRVLN